MAFLLLEPVSPPLVESVLYSRKPLHFPLLLLLLLSGPAADLRLCDRVCSTGLHMYCWAVVRSQTPRGHRTVSRSSGALLLDVWMRRGSLVLTSLFSPEMSRGAETWCLSDPHVQSRAPLKRFEGLGWRKEREANEGGGGGGDADNRKPPPEGDLEVVSQQEVCVCMRVRDPERKSRVLTPVSGPLITSRVLTPVSGPLIPSRVLTPVSGPLIPSRVWSVEELRSRLASLEPQMEQEIEEIRQRYQAKKQPILDAIQAKKKHPQHAF
ncbi:hypothetical protein CRUP_012709 [Coryphaenoides rupestris]|nr:hypothetical protein CRUP_012709 [Coryphaenoides rupestris]